MTARKLKVYDSFVATGMAFAKTTPAGSDALIKPQPLIPKRRAHGISDDAILAFNGQDLRLELTAPIKIEGGAPVIVTTDLEGRGQRTAVDPAVLMTASLTVICQGPGAQAAHDALMARCVDGQVLRLYGPMVGPGGQGRAWCFAGLPDVDGRPLMNGDGTLRRWNAAISLVEWNPLGSLAVVQGSRVSPGKSRKAATAKGAKAMVVRQEWRG